MAASGIKALVFMFCKVLVLFLAVGLSTGGALRDTFGSKSRYAEPPEGVTAAVEAENRVHNCTYDVVFLVARHGSRWPTLKHLTKYDKLKRHLEHLNWTHSFHPIDEGLLTSKGEKEMRALGERFRRSFPSIFESHPGYHPRRYEFRSSQVPRALQSATAFALGLFGTDYAFAIESDSKENDNLLRFHDNCANYSKTKKSLTPKMEIVLKEVLERVRLRVGANKETFDVKDLDALWSACLFEATALDALEHTCAFFSLDDARVLEYVNDVKDYWEKSHGQDLNYKMACVLMRDVLTSLEGRRNRFYFGHAETIMPVVAFLGLFKDTHHIGYDTEKDLVRKWRSGVVSPFAANIAFTSKFCFPQPGGDDVQRKRYVEIRHNEAAMDVAHLCSHEGESPKMKFACSFDAFKTALETRIGQCNFHEMCAAT